MSGALIVCIENDPAILDGMKTLLTAWDAEVIAVADPEAAIGAIEAAGGRVTGLLVDLSSRPRQRRRRDPRHPPPFWREHSGDPDHRRPQPERPGRRARGEHRRCLNKPVKPASLRALLGPVAHAADGGGGVATRGDRVRRSDPPQMDFLALRREPGELPQRLRHLHPPADAGDHHVDHR